MLSLPIILLGLYRLHIRLSSPNLPPHTCSVDSKRIVKADCQGGRSARWHRKGFRLYWDALSRKGRKPGRPQKDREIRDLIRRMAAENPTWGAPRVHAELLKLGFEVAERTVSWYLPKRPPNPDKIKLWMAFLRNHRGAIAAMDLFTIPMLTFQILYGLGKDAPIPRPVQSRISDASQVIALPKVGGLHHRYEWRDAA